VTLFQNITECSFPTEDLTHFGIVQRNCEGKLNFNHSKLADYCVAYCLVNRLTEGKNISQQVQTFVLKDMLLKPNYGVIKSSYGCLLSRSKL
jgi:hypothetical protein